MMEYTGSLIFIYHVERTNYSVVLSKIENRILEQQASNNYNNTP